MTEDDTYITLDQDAFCELFQFKDERNGLQMGGPSNESPALMDLIQLAKSHPDTDL